MTTKILSAFNSSANTWKIYPSNSRICQYDIVYIETQDNLEIRYRTDYAIDQAQLECDKYFNYIDELLSKSPVVFLVNAITGEIVQSYLPGTSPRITVHESKVG